MAEPFLTRAVARLLAGRAMEEGEGEFNPYLYLGNQERYKDAVSGIR